MKKALLSLGLVAVVLLGVLLVRAALHTPPSTTPIEPVEIPLDAARISGHLADAVRFPTISHQDASKLDESAFSGFVNWVRETYPEVLASMPMTLVGGHTILLRWPGSDPALKPVLLTGHYDVVPVIPGTEKDWTHPPFAGVVAEGIVWGRGALDDKSAVIAQLEAVTELLRSGFTPRRTVWFSFGHDEEVGGRQGAGAVVELLRKQGVTFEWTLDEGSFLMDGMMPGIESLIAPINVAEKGYLTLRIIARGDGGHSSMPPAQTAVGVLAEAIRKLEAAPLPGGLDGVSGEMFDAISRHMAFGYRLLFANRWLFGPVLEDQLDNTTFGNAMLRTTTAPTMLSGSIKANVLPIEAVATVNFRLHPRDTVEGVVEYVRTVVADEKVEVRIADDEPGSGASEVSDWTAPGFGTVGRSVREIYPDAVVVPGIMIAASDTRHYGQLADDSWRFNPMIVTPQVLTGFHGTDERIPVDNLVNAVRVYMRIIQNSADRAQ
jgi:carboxypeptidase PM20D1